jgi:predicted oxidoreductase (fatty acid repression mutant protein)
MKKQIPSSVVSIKSETRTRLHKLKLDLGLKSLDHTIEHIIESLSSVNLSQDKRSVVLSKDLHKKLNILTMSRGYSSMEETITRLLHCWKAFESTAVELTKEE